MRALILWIRRALDLEPPADGLCNYERRIHVQQTTGYYDWSEFVEVHRCRYVWHHDSPHGGEISRERYP